MQKIKKQNGITLIALIITIIVMLILVAVTLVITLGENGIIAKARTAKEKQALRQNAEKSELGANAGDHINALVEDGTPWDLNTSGEEEVLEPTLDGWLLVTIDVPEEGTMDLLVYEGSAETMVLNMASVTATKCTAPWEAVNSDMTINTGVEGFNRSETKETVSFDDDVVSEVGGFMLCSSCNVRKLYMGGGENGYPLCYPCNCNTLVFLDSVTALEENCYGGGGLSLLTEVYIPSTVGGLEYYTFYDFDNLNVFYDITSVLLSDDSDKYAFGNSTATIHCTDMDVPYDGATGIPNLK